MDKKPLTQRELLEQFASLVELVPDIRAIVEERKEQEIFNRKAAKIGRFILVISGAVGTVLGTMWAVAKLIVNIGSNA